MSKKFNMLLKLEGNTESLPSLNIEDTYQLLWIITLVANLCNLNMYINSNKQDMLSSKSKVFKL